MAFWSTNDVEPKRNFRFKVEITALGGNSVLWWAKTVSTPSFDVSETEHNFLDNKYYFPGRVTWSEVSLTLVDPISVDAVALTNTILEASGYGIPSGPPDVAASLSTISKPKASAALGNVVITVLKADGNPNAQNALALALFGTAHSARSAWSIRGAGVWRRASNSVHGCRRQSCRLRKAAS